MSNTVYKNVPFEDNDVRAPKKKCEQDSTNEVKPDGKPLKYGYGVRHVQSFIFFLCLTLGYASRAHLGVTIVAMAMVKSDISNLSNTTELSPKPDNASHAVREGDKFTNETNRFDTNGVIVNTSDSNECNTYKTYDWPKSIQEMVLGSFFLGYCLMMFPIGLVCQKWGGKIPLQIAMIVNAVVSFGTPWVVAWGGWKALCACRILQGFSQSGLYPAIHTLLSNWVPASERGSMSSYVYTGSGLGTVLAFQLAGILGYSRFGWPSTFWVSGVTCFIAFVLITLFGAAKPTDHKSISDAEKNYISGTVGQTVETKAKVPWKYVLTSVHTWALFVAHVGNAMCYVFIFIQVPTYMFAILHLNIRNSGILSSLPFIATFLSSIVFGFLSDFCTNRKIISIKNARRLSNTIALTGPALVLFVVTYTTITSLAVFWFVVALAAHAACHTGWMVNYIDVSPNYTGALFAFGNTLTNIVVVGLPVLVSNIVTDVTNQYQWRVTMFLMGSISTAANIFFVIFMSVDVQPWNDYLGNSTNNNKDAESIILEPQKEINN